MNSRFTFLASTSACAVLTAALLVGCAQDGSGTSSPPEREADASASSEGEKIYRTRCMSCHQMDGQGVAGVFPPLVGTDWVIGDKGRLVRVILHGVTGPMTVNGEQYTGAMPPWAIFLTDEEVAAVSNYIRSSWGNEAEDVTPSEVAAVREATANRATPWTEEALEQAPNMGIPGQ